MKSATSAASSAAARTKPSSGNRLLVVMMAVGTAAFLWLSFWPTNKQIGELQEQLRTNSEQLQEALLLPAKLDRQRDEVQRTTRFVAAWRQATGDSTASVFAAISHAIGQQGAVTTQFVPEPSVQRGYLRETTVRIACQGTLEQIFAALQSLEALPFTLWVDELRLLPDRDDQAKLKCEMKLVIFAEKSKLSD
jgi:Tfp pilus assembly protein PilO